MQWRSRWYARWPNHEFVDFGCRHRTMSVTWTAQTSRAGYIAAIYPLGCKTAWNPSKPPRHSSFVHRYLWHIFWPFSVLHTKNQETYFHQWILYELMTNYLLKHNFFLKKKISYCFLSYLVAAWFSHTLLATLSCALSHSNLFCI